MQIAEKNIASNMELQNDDKIIKDALAILKSQIGNSAYNSWILPLEFNSINAGIVHFSASTRFIRDWVNNNYLRTASNIFAKSLPNFKKIEITIDKKISNQQNTDHLKSVKNSASNNNQATTSFENKAPKLDCSFDNYVSDKSNMLAYKSAKAVADGTFLEFGNDSLVLYGNVGLGKTHLLKSIYAEIAQNDPSKRVQYISAENFMFKFVKSLKANNIVEFKEGLRNIDILLVDDLQFLTGKKTIQEEFFHTYNSVIEAGGIVVLTCDKDPVNLNLMDGKLKSRICSSFNVEITRPEKTIIKQIVIGENAKSELCLSEEQIEIISSSKVKNIRDLKGILNRIKTKKLLMGEVVDNLVISKIVREYSATNICDVTIQEIKKTISDEFGVSIKEIDSSLRKREIVRARQAAMYICKKLTTDSLPVIGKNFGGRDHTTVIHAIKSVDKLKQAEASFDNKIENVLKILQN